MRDTGLVVALATSAAVPRLGDDDQLLVRALAAAGVRAEPAVWNDAAQDWRRYSAIVIRSTWDYHLRHDEFLAWLDTLDAAGRRVFNAPALVRWNAEKRYLRDLAARGTAVVPTRWVERDEETSLAEILAETRWREVVVKPSVSASAHQTWRVSSGGVNANDERFASMVASGRVLVQPFLPAIQAEGEWSLLFYGGRYSHAVLKRPQQNDFRVQREHGGTADVGEASHDVIDAAHRALEAVEMTSLYARVDGCIVDGTFVLMELELIEPDLFLRAHPQAPDRLASALLERL